MTAAINVDPAEIKKFSDLASRWWDKESEFKPLHQINPLRLDYISDHAAGLACKKIIDVGCGGGILADSMAQKQAIVTAIDMGDAPLSVAKLHQLESGQDVDYQKSTAEDFAQSHSAQFDIVTCMEMMEHVPDPSSIVNALSQLVKPGGDIFVSTINRSVSAFLGAIVAAEYLLKLLPKGTHQYKKFIRPSEIANWARQAELELIDMAGMHYNPLTKNYSLAPGVKINYLMHFKRLNG
ncbi:MAG: bifunctional 2-polyprenyl-6-hydroxyphenol methylase/3-demethylubiquinol 3-O-methyltransferase UbiG [Enterobacterales bacterium]|nr:bifunctional 2-polyprenyl-6-hydroxyphenol methylase/3-demethylubiquinol 3-O-methyltransferase UbiG [Enterobacterales bacterium]